MKTRRRSYLQHGRRHGPQGSDPIPGIGGPRISWGRLYSDGDSFDTGSGDWESGQMNLDVGPTNNAYFVTVTPPFNTQPAVNVTPSGAGSEPFSAVPPLLNSPGNSWSGFVTVVHQSLDTFVILFWDQDGNYDANVCGFDFIAVGT